MIFWSIVFVIGASQATWLALALWRRPVNRPGNRVLAAWIALIGFDLAIKALYFSEPAASLYKLYRFVGLFPFLYGSLFYLYVRSLTQARAPGWRDSLHLLGFAVALATKASLFLASDSQIAALFAARRNESPTLWLDIFLFGYSLSYVAAALLRVMRYRRGLLARRSDADRVSLHWVDTMAISQIVIWCIATARWITPVTWLDYPMIYGAVVMWMFTVGYLSLGQVELPAEPEPEPEPEPGTGTESRVSDTDDARFPAVEARLAQLMQQEHAYREPALTIAQLARRSGYPEYLVSAVINRRFDGNFWEYINRHRTEAVRACLADTNDGRSILDIAYACGFTAKSTFNAAFKRQLGATPSQYRQQQAEQRARSAGSGE